MPGIVVLTTNLLCLSLLVLIEYLLECWCDFLKGIQDRWIKMFWHGPSVTLVNDGERLLMVKCGFVGPSGGS